MDAVAILAVGEGVTILMMVAAFILRRRGGPREVDCTIASFRRWLRAQRPPLPWFLGISEDEQELLAQQGTAYSQEVCVGIGWAVQNPAAAEAATRPTDETAEENLLEQVLQAATARVLARSVGSKPPAADAQTMAGLSERREAAATKQVAGKRFLGRRAKGAT